jgi:curli biogenesis system outer membrane secretion channel CsgG
LNADRAMQLKRIVASHFWNLGNQISGEMMKKNLANVALLVMVSGLTTFAQNEASSSRLKAEQAIRSAVYELTSAALTANVKSYKEQAAQHMLDLYKLIYEESKKDPETRKSFDQNGIKSWEDLMASRVRQSARRFASLSRMQIAELARREADGAITFVTGKECKIRAVRIVLEGNEWKGDAGEAIKRGLLRNPDNRLSPESRAKIEKF